MTTRTLQFHLKEWLSLMAAWILFLYFYYFIAYYGIKNYLVHDEFFEYIDSVYAHLEIVVTAILFGILFNLINMITETHYFQKKSFGRIILIKSFMYMVSLLIVVVIMYFSFKGFGFISQMQIDKFLEGFSYAFVLSIVAYFSFIIVLLNFFIQLNKKLGPGMIQNLLFGKYHQPLEEHRVFMFIDLKGSTRLAEIFGHHRYSQFLRECVHELTPIIIKYQAKVYQYVGDEIVLSWKQNGSSIALNCLDAFFEYQQRLLSRREYFQKKYGQFPIFKAGVDVGEVTTTEIGDIKREIAYHGDVLNIASRLEKLCNQYEKRILITENFKNYLSHLNGYHLELVGDIQLKGKTNKVKVYTTEAPSVTEH